MLEIIKNNGKDILVSSIPNDESQIKQGSL